jgi:deoxyribodipyrimidine photo-lyase
VISAERIRVLSSEKPRTPVDGARYVLYWAQMNRRVESNHALAYAAEVANANKLPLLIYEGLACDYPSANDRLHTFILEGVPDNAAAAKKIHAGYFFYSRRTRKDPNDVLCKLAANAHSVVTDDYPVFIAAQNNARVPGRIGIPYIAVDSSCIVPMNRHEKRNYAAYAIRPKIRRELKEFLRPVEMPAIEVRWRERLLPHWIAGNAGESEIDHSVRPSVEYRGGSRAAHQRLQSFLGHRLRRYANDASEPSKHATSGLSPYLHFGHISSLEVALAVSAHAEQYKLMPDEFLEQLIVRRELAFNFARFAGDQIASLDVLPDWCRRTMEKHAADKRPYLYTPEQFEKAETHDPLWNAAQRELLLRGTIHGYYRMYWGKKIIEWSPTYEEALRTMIHLHDVYALDGRDPNTYTNILWCFGLHDRPWAERPVFGQLRCMTFEGMKRKTDVDAYIREIQALGEYPL